MSSKISKPFFIRTSSLLIITLALGLSGCAHNRFTTGSIGTRSGKSIDQMTGPELQAASEAYGKAYEHNAKDKNAALAYANILRRNGRNDQSLAVMRQTAIYFSNDREVLAAYGKALAGDGQLAPALETIRRAQRPEFPDWKLISAEGAILDQQGHPQEARALYQKALDLQPGEASIQSNQGMSYLLEGDLRTAETYFTAEEEADHETLADEHSLNQQRYFNMVCWVYGSNPDDNEELLEDRELPEARAEQCPDEYALINRSWSSLLANHLR